MGKRAAKWRAFSIWIRQVESDSSFAALQESLGEIGLKTARIAVGIKAKWRAE